MKGRPLIDVLCDDEDPCMPPGDPPRSRNVKLTDAEWAALERIALANGLEWGGIPSRSEAIRLLIRRELERQRVGSR